MSGMIVWITGLPSSGKSTLARGMISALRERELAAVWLDSDDLRSVLTPNATYSPAERDQFYAALAHLAGLVSDAGAIAVVSATASKRAYRDAARARVDRFAEIWLTCDMAELRRRDSKGLYARAAAGELDNVPGAGATYEPPEHAELVLDSGRDSPAELVAAATRWLDSALAPETT